jgi:hypothetical protein
MVFLHADSKAGLSKTKKLVYAREKDIVDGSAGKSPDSSVSSQKFNSLPYRTVEILSEVNRLLLPQSPSASMSAKKEKSRSRSSSPEFVNMTLLVQMDDSSVLIQQFVSHWILKCQAAGLTWMSVIPPFLATSSPSSFAVQTALLAASLAFHGKLTNDKSILIEAYKWYGFGLRKQRSLLECFCPEKRQPILMEICMPIMLTTFESVCGTNLAAYFQHAVGAARMLEMMGPEACGSNELHSMFSTVRVQMVCDLPVCSRRNTDFFSLDLGRRQLPCPILFRSTEMAYSPIRRKSKVYS